MTEDLVKGDLGIVVILGQLSQLIPFFRHGSFDSQETDSRMKKIIEHS